MSWWNAKYKNAHDEYEITFGSKYKEKTKIVERVCKWIIDKLVQSEDDIAIVRHGRWISFLDGDHIMPERYYRCSECGRIERRKEPYCHCGAKMQGGSDE